MTVSKVLLNVFLLLLLISGIKDYISSNYLLLYFDICVFVCSFIFGNMYLNEDKN